jgi:hypothetical protein
MEVGEIDLYGDVDDGLNASSASSRDLYDDAVTQPAKEEAGKQTEAAPAQQRQAPQRPRGFSVRLDRVDEHRRLKV